MRGSRGIIVAALALALSLPASASAEDGRVSYVIFSTPASHGYELDFVARDGKRSRASLGLSRGRAWAAGTSRNGEVVEVEFGRGISAAAYEPEDVRVSGRRLAVDLGPLGSIAMRFEERSGRSIDRRCLSGRIGRGQLVGSLEFEGEAGYARAERTRVRARIATVRRTCAGGGRRAHGGAAGEPGPWRGPRLFACGPLPGTLLLAARDRYVSDFTALAFERAPYATIARYVSALRPAADFAYRRDLTSATLRPSPPLFSGAASYGDGATTGDLRARLPGRGMVPMAGGEATLTRGTGTILDCPGVPASPWMAAASPRDGANRLREPVSAISRWQRAPAP